MSRIKTNYVSATSAQSAIQQCGCGGKVQNKDAQLIEYTNHSEHLLENNAKMLCYSLTNVIS